MDFKQTYFSIWQDAWNLHKKYAFIDKDDSDSWVNLVKESGNLQDKYSMLPESEFANKMILNVISEIENRTKR